MKKAIDGRIAANKKRSKITDAEILVDVENGLTLKDIAEKHGVHIENLRKRMRRLGISQRPKLDREFYSKIGKLGAKAVNGYNFGTCWHYVESQDKRFSRLHQEFQYLETRKNESGNMYVRLKCKKCGKIIERTASTGRQYRIECERCRQDEKEKRQIQEKRTELVRFLYALKESKKPKMCACCGKSFYSQYSLQAYCSDKCKRKAKKSRRKERNPESFRKTKSRAHRHIQRARKYGCTFEYGVTLKAVIKRDNGICQICGKPCDENDRTWGFAGPLYPSVDHIIPLCRQGSHTWENVQLAHMICNSEKRDLITV